MVRENNQPKLKVLQLLEVFPFKKMMRELDSKASNPSFEFVIVFKPFFARSYLYVPQFVNLVVWVDPEYFSIYPSILLE